MNAPRLAQAPLAGLALALSVSGPVPAAGWETGPGFRSRPLDVSPGNKAGFTLLASQRTGIDFTNFLAQARHLASQVLMNGAGLACGDVDGDGWCDVYFCGLDGPNLLYRNLGGWKFQDITAEAGVACPNVDATGAAFADLDGDGALDLVVNSIGAGTLVFRNDGKGRFSLVTRLNLGRGGTSLALADIDGDGFLDLYVANYRTNALMDMPDTRFWFKETNGVKYVSSVNGRPVTEPDLRDRYEVTDRGGVEELGEPDVLYRNRGGTEFTPVACTDGSFLGEDGQPLPKPPLDWALSVMFHDLNGDGLPDLYLCNDFTTPDRIWLNAGSPREITGAGLIGQQTPTSISRGKVRFRAAPWLALRKTSLFAMGVDVADINRDGHDDLFVLDMLSREHVPRLTQMQDRRPTAPVIGEYLTRPQYMLNTLQLSRGDGTFAEIGLLAGVAASEWSWTAIFLDVDLDGWEDLLVSNGHERDARNLDLIDRLKAMRTEKTLTPAEVLQTRKILPRLRTANLAFRNRRDLTFEEVGKQWGFDTVGVSHGMALADLDNDGDLDVVINNMNEPAGIYRNDSSAPRVAVRLKGKAPNTRGIGAKIKVLGGPVPQTAEMICGGRYLSSDEPVRTFAAGSLTNDLTFEVTWRSGARTVVTHARANRVYEIEEEKSVVRSQLSVAATAGTQQRTTDNGQRTELFQDASHLLQHTHRDAPFEDFERQPLLEKQLCQLGPGVSWADLDGDGWEDLIIASGKGGRLAAHRNDGGGGFVAWDGPPLTQAITRDQTTVLAWHKAPGHTVLLAGSANYEDGLAVGSCVRQFDWEGKAVDDRLPAQESSTGPLALADVDGDGGLDLFVGGRVLPGRYPRAASSLLFRSRAGRLEPEAENTRRFAGIGLVSGAVFSDLDGDGDPDLILACEWGPLRIFRNERGQLVAWDPPVQGASSFLLAPSSFSALTGWWNGVTTGDFDGDGRLDIAASNWGRNTNYESHRAQPLRVFYGDFDRNGTEDLISAYVDPLTQKVVPERMLSFMARGMPALRERYPTYAAFARADVSEILGPQAASAKELRASWLESAVFLNRGDRFEARVLPIEAQMAPAFALGVADLDGDGHEDLFLSQNFFDLQPETARLDAGRGLCLRGDGHGGFTAMPGQESGVKVYGQQRGAAVCDFDGDGRVDLAVSQNGAETKLYRNVGARPGLRVRLNGPPGNPTGVGATLRLGMEGKFGPAREIHAGSGYWSQDSAVQVLSAPVEPAQLEVRWPGGKKSVLAIPAGAKEIAVDIAGTVKAGR